MPTPRKESSRKRKREAPDETGQKSYPVILYPSGKAFWLHCFLTEPRDQSLHSVKDKSLAAIEIAKVIYLLYHEVSEADIHVILTWLDLRPGEEDDKKKKKSSYRHIRDKIIRHQRRWDRQVFENYIIPLVERECYGRDEEYLKLDEVSRQERWVALFEKQKDNETVACGMFDQVLSCLDQAHVFEAGVQDRLHPDDKVKMKAVRTMLLTKFVFACELAYKYRVAGRSRIKIEDEDDYFTVTEGSLFASWKSYRHNPEFNNTIVPLADLPVAPLTMVRTHKGSKIRRVREEGQKHGVKLRVDTKSKW